MRNVLRVWGLSVVVCAFGCGSQPVPMEVVEGTTMLVTIPAGIDVGFGRAWAGDPDETLTTPAQLTSAHDYNATGRMEDLQRGELIFLLSDPADPSFPTVRMPVRLITSATLDPGSTEALDSTNSVTERQAVALLDVPAGIIDDRDVEGGGSNEGRRDLEIRIRRYRRDGTGTFVLVPYTTNPNWRVPSFYTPIRSWDEVGWGSVDWPYAQPDQSINVAVVDHPEPSASEPTDNFTPREGWYTRLIPPACAPMDVRMEKEAAFEAMVADSIPNPELIIQSRPLAHGGNVRPAGWDVELAFPRERMRVLGVIAERENPSGALVTWQSDAPVTVASSCNTANLGTLTIQVADADRRTEQLRVAFELVNTDVADSTCRTPIVTGDIAIQAGSSQAFDENGQVITTANFFAYAQN